MPSISLHNWRTRSAKALDEIEAAHAALGGAGPGRRYATQQVNYAYAMLLCSQFQKFCRDLHTECADVLAGGFGTKPIADARSAIFKSALVHGRKLDIGNPNPANIGSDFGRFGLDFWQAVAAAGPGNSERQRKLQNLTDWRNSIAHQDFERHAMTRRTLRLRDVRNFRSACDGLVRTFDFVMRRRLEAIIGIVPW